jgi:parvulin-like peptidyl-prolyl isomerase
MIRHFVSLFLLIFFLLSLPACLSNGGADKYVVIKVGDRPITQADIEREVNITALENGVSRKVVWESIDDLVDRIVDNALILEYGEKIGIALTEVEFEKAIENIVKDYPDDSFKETILTACIDYNEWKERFRKQLLVEKITKKRMESVSPVSYLDIKSYYQERKEEFWHPPRAKYMHIITKTREDAEAIFARIKEGEDMAALVKKQSNYYGIPGEDGKDWKTKDMLPEPLSDIVFSMPLGKPSNVIKTKYGFHIIEVLQRESEGSKELLEVSNDIEKELLSEARERFYIGWLRELRNNYPVKINHALLNEIKTRSEESKS